MDLVRTPMYEHVRNALAKEGLIPLRGSVLAISGLGTFRSMLDESATVTETHWPEVSMLDLPFPDNTFDVVISDQILEHIEGDPRHAVMESWRVLKPGGIAIHTSVFMYRIHHKHPGDYWRFSTYGLRELARPFTRIIECDGWGNRASQILLTLFPRITTKPIDHGPWRILQLLLKRNAPNYHSTVWIIAKK